MALQSLTALLLLVLVSCAALTARSESVQKVSSRSSSDDENGIAESEGGAGGSQSRAIFSHKHLSPHRMMHFGKRLLIQQAPGIYTTPNEVFDLFHRQPSEQQQEQQEPTQQTASMFPYTLYFPMQRDRVLESVQPEPFGMARDRQMINAVQNLLRLAPLKRQQQPAAADGACDDDATTSNGYRQQQVQFKPPALPKLMRLMKADGQQTDAGANNDGMQTIYAVAKKHSQPAVPSSSSNNNNAAGAEIQAKLEAGQQEEQDANASSNGRSEGDEIDRASRSVGASRPLMTGLTRAQFSMLFGGQPNSNSQATSLLNFIKKAEPQRMTFMHFGRRR